MIVDSMTHEEVYQELERDREGVTRWWPHMLKQYAARCNVDKSGKELVKHYFMHNAHNKNSHDQRVVGKSVRYNDEEHLSCCVNEGVLLGQVYGDIFIARTFITYEMCSGLQEREFESCRRRILTDRELYDAAREFYRP